MDMVPLAAEFAPASRQQWLDLIAKAAGAAGVERLASATIDGLPIAPLYCRDELPPLAAHAIPGAPPFVRGGVAGRPDGRWDVRVLHAGGDAGAVNRALLEDLAGGATSATLQLAAPGQYGLPLRYDAIAAALADVHLDLVTIGLAAGDQYIGAAQSIAALWEERGTPVHARRVAINADPLGHLARTGALENDLWSTLDVLGRLASSETFAGPDIAVLLADGTGYHEAGASEAQELAAMLATAIEYLRLLETDEGLPPARGMQRLAFALAADGDLFMTIAKLRAARLLVWRMLEASGAGIAAGSMRLAAVTSARMLTRADPAVNILRATVAAAGAAMGGADSLTVLPYTAALGAPDAAARRLARNTGIVLQEESGLGQVLDPAGGSGLVESLTLELARRAWSILQEVEAAGGMARSLLGGFWHEAIGRTVEARRTALANGDASILGVTAFPPPQQSMPTVTPHPAVAPIERAETRIAPLAALSVEDLVREPTP